MRGYVLTLLGTKLKVPSPSRVFSTQGEAGLSLPSPVERRSRQTDQMVCLLLLPAWNRQPLPQACVTEILFPSPVWAVEHIFPWKQQGTQLQGSWEHPHTPNTKHYYKKPCRTKALERSLVLPATGPRASGEDVCLLASQSTPDRKGSDTHRSLYPNRKGSKHSLESLMIQTGTPNPTKHRGHSI